MARAFNPNSFARKGQRFEVTADWVNAVGRVARGHREKGMSGETPRAGLRNDQIRFRNDTGQPLERGLVIGLGDATTPHRRYANECRLIGRKPLAADAGRFGVVTGPVPATVGGPQNPLGAAILDGAVMARVRMQREHHRFAEIEPDKLTLRSVPIGSAAILWVQPKDDRAAAQGDDEQVAWAIVRLGMPQLAVEYRVVNFANGLNAVGNSSLLAVPAEMYDDYDPEEEGAYYKTDEIYCSMYSGNPADPEEDDLELYQPAMRVGSRIPVVAREFQGEVRACCAWPFLRQCDEDET